MGPPGEVDRRREPALNRELFRSAAPLVDGKWSKAWRPVLDMLEQKLERCPYPIGDRLTVADIRLFVTLARFDAATTASSKAISGALPITQI